MEEVVEYVDDYVESGASEQTREELHYALRSLRDMSVAQEQQLQQVCQRTVSTTIRLPYRRTDANIIMHHHRA